MKGHRGTSFFQVLAGVAAALLLVLYVLSALRPQRGGNGRMRCRSDLNQLSKGMATYLNEFGNNAWYPFPLGLGRNPGDFNGAEWLASLYWTGVVPDPGVFLCPSSLDTNRNGLDLGSHRAAATFSSGTVSYAAMHYRSLTNASGSLVPGAIKDNLPSDAKEPMACDDTQGAIHHGTKNNGGMNVLFFDSHVEFRTNAQIDLEFGVGQQGGLLWRLRN